MHRNQEGFTLPEILIGLAISSIIIAASFASYIVIKQNYDFQKDMKNISQTSRAVATMIMRDVRMAGYNYDDGPSKQKPEITNSIKIYDGGSSSPDSIEIIYDKSYTERLKISYYTKTYNNRLRVYKKVDRCNAMNCAVSSLQTVIAESPIADYVDDLQFTGTKGNCIAGQVMWGCGSAEVLTPTSIRSDCETIHPSKNSATSGNARYAFDNNWGTIYSCRGNMGKIFVKFNKKVQIQKVTSAATANLDGGSIGPDPEAIRTGEYSKFVYPFGATHTLRTRLEIKTRGSNECSSYNSCTPANGPMRTQSIYYEYTFPTPREHEICLDHKISGFCNGDQLEFVQTIIDAGTEIEIQVDYGQVCNYDSSSPRKCANGNHMMQNWQEVPEIQFWGYSYGNALEPREVEISLLIRSPDEHGTTPISQSWNIGNRVINTNDNYIRDTYSTSALIRNEFYGP